MRSREEAIRHASEGLGIPVAQIEAELADATLIGSPALFAMVFDGDLELGAHMMQVLLGVPNLTATRSFVRMLPDSPDGLPVQLEAEGTTLEGSTYRCAILPDENCRDISQLETYVTRARRYLENVRMECAQRSEEPDWEHTFFVVLAGGDPCG